MKIQQKLKYFAATSFFGLMTACGGGSGEGVSTGQATTTNPGTVTNTGGATSDLFNQIQNTIFTPSCAFSGCHLGASAPQGLRLNAGISYSQIVDVPSSQQPNLNRITPGNLSQSYLYQKVTGVAASGSQMPLVGGALTQNQINLIAQWITEGAPEVSTGGTDTGGGGTGGGTTNPTVPTIPTVSDTNPAQQASLSAMPTSITLVFSDLMDVGMLSQDNIQLLAAGGDGQFNNGNEITIGATAAYSNQDASLLNINITEQNVADDTFQLSLLENNTLNLKSASGVALDGDSNGSAGGIFRLNFSVTTPNPNIVPTLAELQNSIFTPQCSGCHDGPTSNDLPEGMDLSSANATYANTVGVTSIQNNNLQRINPSNANQSYLINKLAGQQIQGSRMPRGGPFLSNADIDRIRAWINAGATANNTTTNPPAGGGETPTTGNSSISISNLSDGDDVNGNVNVTNNISNFTPVQVELLINGNSVASSSSQPFLVVWRTNQFNEDRYQVSLRARNSAGQSVTSLSVRIDVKRD